MQHCPAPVLSQSSPAPPLLRVMTDPIGATTPAPAEGSTEEEKYFSPLFRYQPLVKKLENPPLPQMTGESQTRLLKLIIELKI
jgi:hypothetical protein